VILSCSRWSSISPARSSRGKPYPVKGATTSSAMGAWARAGSTSNLACRGTAVREVSGATTPDWDSTRKPAIAVGVATAASAAPGSSETAAAL